VLQPDCHRTQVHFWIGSQVGLLYPFTPVLWHLLYCSTSLAAPLTDSNYTILLYQRYSLQPATTQNTFLMTSLNDLLMTSQQFC